MHFLKLLVITLFTIHLAIAQEAPGLALPPVIDDGPGWPSGMERHPGSVFDPPGDGTGYRFALAAEPRPTNWGLLLGALLSGGFIVRRRLAAG